jgi:diguanylate cyclase (GGDEF)-like protein
MAVALLSWPALGRAQEVSWRGYGREQGLDNVAVYALLQDSRGALWAGTEGGLYRNHGAGFERLGRERGILDLQIHALHEDAAGRLWVAGASRLYRRAGDADSDGFVAVTLDGQDIPSLEGQRIASTADGHVLVASRGRLLRARRAPRGDGWTVDSLFDASAVRRQPELAAVRAVFSSTRSGTWFGCGTALCQLVGREVHRWGPEAGVPEDTWEGIFADRESQLWVRGYRHVRVLPPGAAEFVARDIPGQSGLASPMQSFAQDRGGAILTRADRGIARWRNGAWTVFDAQSGLPPYGVAAILVDRDGQLWLGTRGNGILRWLGYGEWENWTERQGLRSTLVWDTLRISPERTLVANDEAVMALDHVARTMTPWPSEATALKQVNTLASTPDGAVWASTYEGAVTRTNPVDGSTTRVASLPISARLFSDRQSRLWALTSEGIYRIEWRDGAPGAHKVTDPVLPAERFSDAAEAPDGALYFVSSGALFRFRDGVWTRIAIDSEHAPRGMTTIACSREGRLWVGGMLPALLELELGVGPDADRAHVRTSWTRPAISSETIYFLRFGPRGWLWVGTDRGVDVFNGRRWRHLTTAEGLLWDDTSEGAFRSDGDGSVWIGTGHGLSHLLRPDALFEVPALELRIDSATLGEHDIALGSDNPVPWSRAALVIQFRSPDLRFDETLRFRYRLRGIEDEWQETTGHSLRYLALPTGEYAFELQAFDPMSGAASDVTGFSLRVLAPWWRTPPFFAAVAILIMAGALLAYRVRTMAMVRERKRLEQLVAERTRELVSEKRELAEARDALVVRATRDALTGLWNRSAILERLNDEFARARRHGRPLAVVVADLDHFKSVNDTYGHEAGDEVLREVARRLLERVRADDLIGRLGGEELLIILPGLSAEAAAERLTVLHHAISEAPVAYEGMAIPVTWSCGVALYAEELASPEALVRQADRALYQAKANGRDRIEFAWTRSQRHVTGEPTPPRS